MLYGKQKALKPFTLKIPMLENLVIVSSLVQSADIGDSFKNTK